MESEEKIQHVMTCPGISLKLFVLCVGTNIHLCDVFWPRVLYLFLAGNLILKTSICLSRGDSSEYILSLS